MKKFFAILLAACLTLSFSVVAFAADSSGVVTPGTPDINNPEIGKYVSSATAEDGSRVDVIVIILPETDPIAVEAKDYDPVNVYEVIVNSPIDDDVRLTLDVYAPGVSESDMVLVRDEWEVLEGANLHVDGNRATFTASVGTIRQWKYFAIVKNFNTVDVENPAEGTDNETDTEGGDTMSADDTDETPAEGEDTTPVEPETTAPAEQNPPTGVVLAVVPMIVAAVAIVISKKR